MLATTVRPPRASVSDVMTRRPIAIEPVDTVAIAAGLLRACRIRHLPVVGGDRLVGVVSLRDVLAADDAERVGTVMSTPVQTTRGEAPVEIAAERLLARRVSCLPVVDGERLIGIFTATDALRFAADALEARDHRLGRDASAASMMTPRPLVTVAPSVRLAAAWQTMQAARVRHLPVTSGDAVVGILSDRDVLAAGRRWLAATDDDDGALVVADAMSPRVVTLAAERAAVDAALLLMRHRVGAVPITRAGALVGILTVSDFLYWIVSRDLDGG